MPGVELIKNHMLMPLGDVHGKTELVTMQEEEEPG